MNNDEGQRYPRVIIADTNVAYIFYFFIESKIVPRTEIKTIEKEPIYFHPIVTKEITAHYRAWYELKGRGNTTSRPPVFFDLVGEDVIEKIISFIKSNTSNDIPVVDTDSTDFFNHRTYYEKERERLQAQWKASGVKGRKVSSKPSINDYSVLFSADKHGYKLTTADEILLSVSKEFLKEDFSYYPEDVLDKIINKSDPGISEKIDEISETLKNLGISFVRARITI